MAEAIIDTEKLDEPNPAASGRGIRVGSLSKEVGSADNNSPNASHPSGKAAEDSGGYNKKSVDLPNPTTEPIIDAEKSDKKVADLTKITIPTPKVEAIINIKKLNKKFVDNTEALKDINLTIGPKEFVSIVGPSGAGKSTLISMLVREEEPTSGHIIIAGRDISTLKRKELPLYRRKVGVVYQDFKLLPRKTVFENIAFALEVCDAMDFEIKDKVPKVIKLIGLEGKEKNYPNELSGGEKQRVAIGRALVHSPKILIADEPTGNLDPDNTWDIISLLCKINEKGTVVLLATHNKSAVDRLKKRVIQMKDGKIVSDRTVGTYAEMGI